MDSRFDQSWITGQHSHPPTIGDNGGVKPGDFSTCERYHRNRVPVFGQQFVDLIFSFGFEETARSVHQCALAKWIEQMIEGMTGQTVLRVDQFLIIVGTPQYVRTFAGSTCGSAGGVEQDSSRFGGRDPFCAIGHDYVAFHTQAGQILLEATAPGRRYFHGRQVEMFWI